MGISQSILEHFCCIDGYFRAYLAGRWGHKSAQSGNDVKGMTVVSTERTEKLPMTA